MIFRIFPDICLQYLRVSPQRNNEKTTGKRHPSFRETSHPQKSKSPMKLQLSLHQMARKIGKIIQSIESVNHVICFQGLCAWSSGNHTTHKLDVKQPIPTDNTRLSKS